MPRINLTDAFVRSVRTSGKRIDYTDTNGSGLTLRVTESGAKSFACRYRTETGTQKRLTIGAYPKVSLRDARDAVREAMYEVLNGHDPVAIKKARKQAAVEDEEMTILAVGVKYFADAEKGRHRSNARSKRASTIALDRLYFDKHIVPRLGDRGLKELSRRQLQDYVYDIQDKHGDTTARQFAVVLRQMYSYAEHWDLIETSPAKSIQFPKSRSRKRVYTKDELRGICAVLNEPRLVPGVSDQMVLPIKLALLTLQRAGEIVGMSMNEINLDDKTWTIPGERTKNRHDHVVPLSDSAIQVIETAIARNENIGIGYDPVKRWNRKTGPLFPSRDPDLSLKRHSMTRAMTRSRSALLPP